MKGFENPNTHCNNTENDQKIEEIKEEIKKTKKIIKEKTQMLKSKKSDLDVLSSESQEEEKKLNSLKTKASKKLNQVFYYLTRS